jgi:hypothetical protein
LISSLLLAAPLCGYAQSLAPAGTNATDATHPPMVAKKASLAEKFGKLPLSFEPNRGQADKSIQFLAHGNGYGLVLNANQAVLTLHNAKADVANDRPTGTPRLGNAAKELGSVVSTASGTKGGAETVTASTDVIRMWLVGGNNSAQGLGVDQLEGTASYFIGNDPAKWHPGLPTYGKVRFNQVYPGIDLVYYGNQRQLEYDFVVAPGASPQPIRLHFEGVKGIHLNADGDLTISARHGDIAFHKPVLYQMVGGMRKPVSGSFQLLADNSAGFAVGSYDRGKPLVIDPTVVTSSFLGGNVQDYAVAVAVNSTFVQDLPATVTGLTYSTDFPLTPGAFESVNKAESNSSQSTAYVAELNSSGTALVYSTYIGGSGGAQNEYNQGDYGHSIAVDSTGDAYITGITFSPDFPVTADAYQKTNKAFANSASTGFVTKLNSNGTGLVYSTYLGGSSYDFAYSIALDSSNNAYIGGLSFSSDYPTTTGAYQRTNNSADNGGWNEFVTKLNTTGSALDYSTYIGGSAESSSTVNELYNMIRIAVDKSNNAYVEGYAQSTDFPTTSGAYQRTNKASGNGGANITVSKFNSTGGLAYSTFIGGSSNPGDYSEGIALDSSDNAYATGYTYSSDFPTTPGAFQRTNKGASSGYVTGFVAKLNSTGSALTYSTYLGGSGGDAIYAIALDSTGDAFVAGLTASTNFPVSTDAFQLKLAGKENAFLTKLNPTGSTNLYSTYLGGKASDGAYGVAYGSTNQAYVVGYTSSSNFPVTKGAFQTTYEAKVNTDFVTSFDFGAAITTTPTTTTLKSSANPQLQGSAVTFTADVTPLSGTGTPTGSVVFNIDETPVATVTLSGGHAEYSTSTLAAGPHYVLGSYGGSTTYGSSGGSLTETITPRVATPAFSPNGGTYSAPVKVTLTDATSGATIYYTLNGDTPTSSSTKYTGPFTVSTTTTVKAIAEKTGNANSQIDAATYDIEVEKQAATPVFSPKAGTYNSVQFVTITDSTPGATIYYTINDTTPTMSSTKYTGPIPISEATAFKALAIASGDIPSDIGEATYDIIGSPLAIAYPATAITSTGATLNGIVDTNGLNGTYYFLYGTSSTALTISTGPGTTPGSSSNMLVSAKLTSLKPATTYYFKAVITTSGGTSSGEVLSFKTE